MDMVGVGLLLGSVVLLTVVQPRIIAYTSPNTPECQKLTYDPLHQTTFAYVLHLGNRDISGSGGTRVEHVRYSDFGSMESGSNQLITCNYQGKCMSCTCKGYITVITISGLSSTR